MALDFRLVRITKAFQVVTFVTANCVYGHHVDVLSDNFNFNFLRVANRHQETYTLITRCLYSEFWKSTCLTRPIVGTTTSPHPAREHDNPIPSSLSDETSASMLLKVEQSEFRSDI